jgi:uncharacterized SAM-binding protein YcdF (DUF218 family)/glycosyltransferase involved in cell wall biosynthesis
MITGQTIVCISSIDWDFIWQGHQEIMATLARAGNLVLFIENTGVRPPSLRDVPRLRQRVRNWSRGVKGFREEAPNLFVYSPLVLPFPYSQIAWRVNGLLLVRSVRRWMRAVGATRPMVLTFLPTPTARYLIRELDPELVVYYCIDDFAASSARARRIRTSEDRLMREADMVWVTSEKLRLRAASFSRDVHMFPFGVNFPQFEAVRKENAEAPVDVRALPRPIVGYVGGVHRFVDQDLIVAVADGLPHASVVLVGPLQTDVGALRRRRNVHLLGARPHRDVPAYIKAFDVALVPYRLGEYTANVYPTKLNEYLAMGTPVVATDLPEIRRFNGDHEDVVSVAGTADGFVGAVRAAVAAGGEGAARRIAVARENSWETRIEGMSGLLEAALERRRTRGSQWREALSRSYRRARRRIAQTAAVLVGLYVLLFHSPAVWYAAEPLKLAEDPRAAQAIVVFAGGVGESGKAGGGYQERVKAAVDLYRAGFAPYLVLSSGYKAAFREAEIMRDLAVSHGVPAEAIVLETQAINTYENVQRVDAILRPRGWSEILLVSSPYHMRRAVGTWRKLAPDVRVIPVTSKSVFYSHRPRDGASLEQIGGLVHEYLGVAAYWWRGWLTW